MRNASVLLALTCPYPWSCPFEVCCRLEPSSRVPQGREEAACISGTAFPSPGIISCSLPTTLCALLSSLSHSSFHSPTPQLLASNAQCMNERTPNEETVLETRARARFPNLSFPLVKGPFFLNRHTFQPLLHLGVIMWLGSGQWKCEKCCL